MTIAQHSQIARERLALARARLCGADPRRRRLDVAITKVDAAKRVVTGIVLEPDVFDSQGDTIDAATIRAAAHHYMEHWRRVGVMHKIDASSIVQIVESYIAPSDFDVVESVIAAEADEIVKRTIKAGTWMMTCRINDDDLWGLVERGDITGFSIGGLGRRVPIED